MRAPPSTGQLSRDILLTRKMVPITGRARSFLLGFKNKIEGGGDRIKTTGLSIYPIREYGSTLYVGLARAISPTNTNFRLTFLLTRLQEALYEDLAV